MNFTWHQWVVIIALDMFLRTIFFITHPSFALAMLLLSFVYLTLLVLFNFLVEPFKLRPVAAGTVILMLTNVLFLLGAFVYLWGLLEIDLEKFAGLVWYTYTLPANIVPFVIACALRWFRIGSDQKRQSETNTRPSTPAALAIDFAWYQWLIIVMLDFLLRGALFFATVPIAVIFAPLISLLNLTMLILTHYFLETFKLHTAVKAAITLTTTNAVLLFIAFVQLQWGSPTNLWGFVQIVGMQVPINIGPFLMMCALSLLRRTKAT